MKKYTKKRKFLDKQEFLQLFNAFITESSRGQRLQKNGQRIKSQTIQRYAYTQKLLTEFCIKTNFEIKLFLVNNLTDKELIAAKKHWALFYDKFTDFLYKKGYYDNYVGTLVKVIRVFFNYMITEKQLGIGYFHRKFYVPNDEIPIVVFSPEQLAFFINNRELEEKLPADLKLIKDVFVFGCTVGLRVSDLMSLKPFNLLKHKNAYYLKVKSKKTATDTSIKLPDYALKIIDKYKNKQATLLPNISKSHFNKQLKTMATYITSNEPMIKVRMKKGVQTIVYKKPEKKIHYTMADHITTHTMRRTAITTMLSLGVKEQVVRKISGHAPNSKEFYKYVAYSQSFVDSETDKMFEKLTGIH